MVHCRLWFLVSPLRYIYILYLLWFINQLITGGHHLVQTSGQLEHGSERIAQDICAVVLNSFPSCPGFVSGSKG